MKANIKFEVDGIKFQFRIPIEETDDGINVLDLNWNVEEFDNAVCFSIDKEPYFFEIYLCRGTLEPSHIIVSKDNGFGYEIYEELSYTEFKVSIIH